MIKVLVNGALGKMGSTVARTVVEQDDMELVAAVNDHGAGKTVAGVVVESNLAEAIAAHHPDVVVDFTRPDVVMDCLRTVLNAKVNAVVGTTGFTQENLDELKALAEKNNVGCLICPNFAMGAVLMMKIAAEVAKYFPKAEIIELHHDQKLDAPSGTAILTAQKMAEARGGGYIAQGRPDEVEKLPHVRGNDFQGMRIHSVRLPGFVASEEIIFGSMGETLTIRNDSINRDCYMPGVMLGCRTMVKRKGLVYGLDAILYRLFRRLEGRKRK
jgi:4-hydroxy-tetrahydrodipicolinate reductase